MNLYAHYNYAIAHHDTLKMLISENMIDKLFDDFIDKEIGGDICYFLNIYANIEEQLKNIREPQTNIISSYNSLPEDWLNVEDLIKSLQTFFDGFIITNLTLEIDKEFINLLTREKTFTLKLPNGETVNEVKYLRDIKVFLKEDFEIFKTYILEPDKHHTLDRLNKLNTIRRKR